MNLSEKQYFIPDTISAKNETFSVCFGISCLGILMNINNTIAIIAVNTSIKRT